MIKAFIYGIILALGLILPLGVQNLFILNQGVHQKRWSLVLPVVITASICDTILILIAVLGISGIVLTFSWVKMFLIICGVLFLIYMGWLTWNTKHDTDRSNEQSTTWTVRKQVIFAISVSLLNPHAILDTIGVIGTASLSFSATERIYFTIGTITTSWVWFLLLSLIGRVVRLSDRNGKVRTIFNKVSAIIMWVSAIYLITTIN